MAKHRDLWRHMGEGCPEVDEIGMIIVIREEI